MRVFFKVFTENNDGTQVFEDKINDFFEDKEHVIIHSMNTILETVDGIGYMNMIVCWGYEYGKG